LKKRGLPVLMKVQTKNIKTKKGNPLCLMVTKK
jgi:hypothetical protein